MKKHECLKRVFDVGAVNRANNKYMWRMVKGRPVGSRERYLWSGISKHDLKDYNGAIADHTKAIDVSPNYADAHEWRGNAKYDLEDYSGAIADYTKAIDINPNGGLAYCHRGMAKYFLEDMSGACEDAQKAQELGADASELIKRACS
jgi:tetratricopeptide (TPR) repeat protein